MIQDETQTLRLKRLLDLRVVEGIAVEARDAEVAAQVEQVDGAQIAGHGDEGEAARGGSEDDGAAKIHAVHHDPDVCGVVADSASGLACGDEVFPAAHVVGSADGFKGASVGDSRFCEAHSVNADAVKLADCVAVVFVVIPHHAGSEFEHRAVEGEAFFHRGLGA